MDTDSMQDAYGAAGRMLEVNTSEEERSLLDEITPDDIVVVQGQYDRVQEVLSLMNMPYKVVGVEDVSSLRLNPDQMLVINCPGNLEQRGIDGVRQFVESGGSLFTTDWALKFVLESAFPGVVEFNQNQTSDAVVKISSAAASNPMLEGIDLVSGDAQWWLERASYPIRILAKDKVEVLVDSHELGRNWGESPVVVTFSYGEGEVLHMISHYYLQRTELRTVRHESSWKEYASEMRAESTVTGSPAAYDKLSLGMVESAYTSSRFLRNSLLRRKMRTAEKARQKSEDSEAGTKI